MINISFWHFVAMKCVLHQLRWSPQTIRKPKQLLYANIHNINGK